MSRSIDVVKLTGDEYDRLMDEREILRQEAERAWREVDFISKERTEHLEWRTKLANDLDECERMRDVLARTVNALDAENKELRSAEVAAWMICEPGCEYGPTFGTENAAWSALTKAPPGSELVELIRRAARGQTFRQCAAAIRGIEVSND